MLPIISILLPTRKRISMLEKSLTSLLEKSKHPARIEICIAYDDDDVMSHDYFHGDQWRSFIGSYTNLVQIIQSPRYGYRDLHLYLNLLAKQSQGQWLFFWGDDAIMETTHWDLEVDLHQNFVGLLHISASNAPINCSILPLFHKKWVELFDCVSPINHADSWISDVCWKAKARSVIPVTVFHDRFEDSGNNQDETWWDKKRSTDSARDYHLPKYSAMRTEWAKKLAEFRSSYCSAQE